MRKQASKQAVAILTADMHLRDDTPECRIDDYAAARARKIAFLRDLQAANGGCPIIDAGDIFNKWEVSSELEGWALRNLPDGIITVPGNHDMPNHSMALYEKSSLHVLEAADKVKILKGMRAGWSFGDWQVTGFPYGEPLEETPRLVGAKRSVAIIHAYVAETVPAFIKDGWTPAQLLRALPGYDLIVSGHNHEPLVHAAGGRLVVNAGTMMRATADQADMRPRCWLWHADDNTVEPAYYPIEAGVVSREHLDKVVERETRLDAFVSRLDGTRLEISLSFEDNLQAAMAKANTSPAVRAMVEEAVDGNRFSA